MNNGLSDSTIDVLLSSKESCDGSVNLSQESIIKILCSKTHACIDSNHDAIISSVSLKAVPLPTLSEDNVTAPRVKHSKHKVVWSEEGVLAYQNLLSQSLPALKSSYDGATEAGSASVLLQVTNSVLTSAAKLTNKNVELGKTPKLRKAVIPSEIKIAMKIKKEALNILHKAENSDVSSMK